MRFIRFIHEGMERFGLIEGEQVVPLSGRPWEAISPCGQAVPLAGLPLLAPVCPSKIVAVGRNYREHAAELGNPVPTSPIIFIKPSTAVIGPEGTIIYPPETKNLHHESELAVVIGKRAHRIAPQDVAAHIWGYTCANDVTARDLQRSDEQWTRAKGFDTFAPLGPWVETELDPGAVEVICRVNGQVRQDGHTQDMVFDVAALVAFIANAMTLLPGDVVLTGTPEGVGPLQPGDRVEVEIQGIGVLRNSVGLA